ncbi:MAG: MarR family winged helix-turn-helix transcriptional regulator [Ginsengibacter sp.]|jgi:DNA-binding MarR family transcriptional regulator
MTKCYDDVILLISKWKDFRTGQSQGDIKSFAGWILDKDVSAATQTDREDFIVTQVDKMKEKDTIPDLANRGVIGHLLGRMNLFVKNYAKIPFQQIGLNNLEEFRLLQMIDRVKNINKSELSNESLMEFTTVVDIVKRFTTQGLIRQVKDNNDKRAIHLQITAKGKDLLNKTYQTLAEIKPNVAGDLSMKEQQTLINLLLRLNNFHTDFFEENYIHKRKTAKKPIE